jgi:hypothetical protein
VELVPQTAADSYRFSSRAWQPVRPEDAVKLSDCRLQLHYAAQFAAAAGISFLEHRSDDSHTSLEWVASLGGLFSRPIPTGRPFRIGARPSKFALLIVSDDNKPIAEYKLHGHTITDATEWVRSQIELLGADPMHYSLRRPYAIPSHEVAIGESFDASAPSHFEELSKWFSNAAALLGSIVRRTRRASGVRCWPHHFDIATLISVDSDRAMRIGMEPGDDYYDEPYFYLNMDPQPAANRVLTRPLWGEGRWHTNEWVGAVLPGSRLGPASAQERQVREFIDSAAAACRALLMQS